MTTCFWSTFESNTWTPLPTTDELQSNNHVHSQNVPGRRITSNGSNGNRYDSNRHQNQNTGRCHFNPRNQQPLNHAFIRSSGSNVFKPGQSFAPVMRQHSRDSGYGDGRRDDRFVQRIVGPLGHLSLEDSKWISLVDQCTIQLKLTEKFRLEKELELTTSYPDKKVSSNNSIPIARIGDDSNRIDRLIMDHLKEHARVLTLVSTMDLYHDVHPGVYSSLQSWLDSTRKLQTVRKQEMLDLQEAGGDGPDLVPGPMLLALEKLCVKTRAARTAFWSAYINFITNEWKESMRNKPEKEHPSLLSTASPKPAPVPSTGASFVTKTGRPLIPFSLPGIHTPPSPLM